MLIVLTRFLWRQNATFAISRHYKRFDVFEEADANKAAGKYDNSSIDEQIDFYVSEGLTPYSLAKLPITSGMKWFIISTSSLFPHLLFMYATYIGFSHFLALHWTSCRCSWRMRSNSRTCSYNKFIHLPLVQWSWSFYFKRPVKLLDGER